MLTIELPAINDEENGVVLTKAVTLEFEHSLLSLSKWEEVFKKPFFNKEEKTGEELVTYVVQMLQTQNPPENFIDRFEVDHWKKIGEYINDNRTATTFRRLGNEKGSNEVITSELMYYWLLSFKIPFLPTETWHLSRLLTLVEICSLKQAKPKKMSKQEQASEYARLNAERRAATGSSG